MINDTENTTEYCEMTIDEYRKALVEIFKKMDDKRKLRFWYRFIEGIEEE